MSLMKVFVYKIKDARKLHYGANKINQTDSIISNDKGEKS